MTPSKTPLRYPGGKQRIAPFIAEIMKNAAIDGGHYVEPYAGGAGIAIYLLLNGIANEIHLNDLSRPVYSFWKIILTQTEDFCRRISRASLTIEEWRRQRAILDNSVNFNQFDVAFSFFYLNRCNRSGIPSAGPIGGYQQNGNWKIDARFPRKELIRRIEIIAEKKKAIHVKNQDAEHYLTTYISQLPKRTLVYCDPPYFRKAERLYLNHYSPEDHAKIASAIQNKINHFWIVSYDKAKEIKALYSKRRSFIYKLQYNASKAYKGTEAFFFSDNLAIPNSSVVKSIDASVSQMSPMKRKQVSGT